MNTTNFIFFTFKFFSLLAAFVVVTTTNPIHSILALVLVFANVSALLLMLKVEFLAISFLVVYVGAIAVLFIFVIMMMNVRLVELNDQVLSYFPFSGLLLMLFLIEISSFAFSFFSQFSISLDNSDWVNALNAMFNIQVIGSVLYTYYFYLFILCGFILLIAMIGSITLTLEHSSFNIKRQNIFRQVSTDFSSQINIFK